MKSIVLLALLSLALSNPVNWIEGQYYAITADMEIQPIYPHETESALARPEVIATGYYMDDFISNGWLYLAVNTSSSYPDTIQAFSAGYFEGYNAYNYIYDTYVNEESMRGFQMNPLVLEWVANQTAWYTQQIEENPSDPWWQVANITFAQWQGMYVGYSAAVAQHNASLALTPQQFYLITYVWDLLDVIALYQIEERENIYAKSHCSFLLKLIQDDLFVSHTTWSWFEAMIKMYKIYNFGYNNPAIVNNQLAYSSQPGCLESGDDFYILNNNRFVGETTLGSNNNATWDYLHTDSVPYWIRINIAVMGWTTQEEFASLYLANRAGTYNNQWLIVDFQQYFDQQESLSNATNIIWMVEEFYGMTSQQDVTQLLLIPQGYVASYNVPFNETLYVYSQNTQNYSQAPRAILFDKYAPGIQNLQEFLVVMRLNNVSDTGDRCTAIASRCDLTPNSQSPSPFGAIDAKATAASLISDMNGWIIAGPTTEIAPPFQWTNWPTYQNVSNGMPLTPYTYTWQYVSPSEIGMVSQISA